MLLTVLLVSGNFAHAKYWHILILYSARTFFSDYHIAKFGELGTKKVLAIHLKDDNF